MNPKKLTSNSDLSCKDYCVMDGGYSCIYCPRFQNTILFQESEDKENLKKLSEKLQAQLRKSRGE